MNPSKHKKLPICEAHDQQSQKFICDTHYSATATKRKMDISEFKNKVI